MQCYYLKKTKILFKKIFSIFFNFYLLFSTIYGIVLFVKRISPSEILFYKKLYPLLIIYTPLIGKASGSPTGLSSLINTLLLSAGYFAKNNMCRRFRLTMSFLIKVGVSKGGF